MPESGENERASETGSTTQTSDEAAATHPESSAGPFARPTDHLVRQVTSGLVLELGERMARMQREFASSIVRSPGIADTLARFHKTVAASLPNMAIPVHAASSSLTTFSDHVRHSLPPPFFDKSWMSSWDFLRAIERYVSELQRPATFKRVFDGLIARRGSSYFEWYRSCVSEFMGRLGSELELVGLRLTLLDELSSEVFDDIRRGQRQNVLSGLVTDASGQELALYHRPPSAASRNRFKQMSGYPQSRSRCRMRGGSLTRTGGPAGLI